MNLQTEKFIEYINSRSVIGAAIANTGWTCSTIELAICLKLFSESKKCRINESEGNLLLNAFRNLLQEHALDFDAYRRIQQFYYHWGECEYEIIKSDLQTIARSESFKRLVKHQLTEYRRELFDENLYSLKAEDFEQEEHPVYTFTYWLDFIDEYPRSASDYRRWFDLKRDLVNLRRIGNAVFARHEWDGIQIKVGK